MNIKRILELPTQIKVAEIDHDLTFVDQDDFRAHWILIEVREMIFRNDSKETILKFIDDLT